MGTANRTASTAIVLKSEYIFLKKYDFHSSVNVNVNSCCFRVVSIIWNKDTLIISIKQAAYHQKSNSNKNSRDSKQFKSWSIVSLPFISLKAFISSDTRKYTNKRTSTNKQNYSTKHSWSLDVPRNPREGSLFFTIELFSLFPVGFSRQGYNRADSDVHWKLS